MLLLSLNPTPHIFGHCITVKEVYYFESVSEINDCGRYFDDFRKRKAIYKLVGRLFTIKAHLAVSRREGKRKSPKIIYPDKLLI